MVAALPPHVGTLAAASAESSSRRRRSELIEVAASGPNM
jgi:hypothetical protein